MIKSKLLTYIIYTSHWIIHLMIIVRLHFYFIKNNLNEKNIFHANYFLENHLIFYYLIVVIFKIMKFWKSFYFNIFLATFDYSLCMPAIKYIEEYKYFFFKKNLTCANLILKLPALTPFWLPCGFLIYIIIINENKLIHS